ncbi:uncharacterized Rho GTPase-activating protein At5g61530 [Cryptomeria japonica]|uniref:uncharacterized Rho GTPase-activating protein At5g61530 n=1 Tax=Cryptomeria japonica TaxID=3369 RepID=UPI0025AD08BB|nr:uncharacterized Rho GTPase-activating protein At5g61530 [Cryptomeria japonica]XP_057863115.1 uncharacterized Rho GTPase-activating protein At5g61530 [Cryptomeria japonica]XP_057863116.1 uncharacterized Rho GTPase-activating protein At5g61530 [Cryptomeria japonica]XP_057863117.1 uncharacterized Rho GTPase-activating protein At5g61530 [Cryptomeria japonica]XP_059072451.1 uncharacterized Rho GTPase-activating protein At5g61530 [Cryptomeria japonica]
MSSTVTSQWREKATGFFSSSSIKLKQASHTAGAFVEEVAKDAGSSVAEAAERAGTAVRTRWTLLQQTRQQQPSPLSRDSVQDRILSAAASTSVLLKRSLSETKEKVASGRVVVGEAAKKTAQRSKTILSNIERWQKGVAHNDVFGVPIEIVVQRQNSSRHIPQLLIKCGDYIVQSGLNAEYIFRTEGDIKVVQGLISLYNEDGNASLPEGTSPIDAAALVKIYLLSLPEPIIPFDLYDDIKDARGNTRQLGIILKRLPHVNHSTLEFVTALLLRVSQKCGLNNMDAHSLAVEMAPTLLCRRDERKYNFQRRQLPLWHSSRIFGPRSSPRASDRSSDGTWTGERGFDDLHDHSDDGDSSNGGLDAASQIPLDDGIPPVDYASVEVVQCLIEQHNTIFTDESVTIW